MKAIAIGCRIHSYRGDAHLFASADYAKRNLASVGDQYFFKHKIRI
jgi:hypothetical protein